jgi:hypothetical protein
MPTTSPSPAPAARLYVIAVVAALLLASPTPVYWDTWGYVRQAIAGDVGGLGLGRPVFVLVSHALARVWLDAGGSVWHVEPMLRVVWTLVSCAAAPLTWAIARQAGLSSRAATLAGLAVAASPAMAHVSGTLLTDGPAAALSLLAIVLFARAVTMAPAGPALPAAAGAVLGLAAGVREQSVFVLAVFALLAWAAPRGGRARLAVAALLGCAIAVAAPLVYVVLTQPGYIDTVRGWLAGMAHDRALKTFGWRDAAVFAGWLLSLGPIVVIAAAAMLTRRSAVWQPRSVMFAVALPSLVLIASTAGLLGVAYSPRFLVAGFPGALAIPGALALDRWAGASRGRIAVVVIAIALPVFVAVPIVRAREAPMTSTLHSLPAMLLAAPADAVIVTGYPCPAIPLVREQIAYEHGAAAAPDWQPVCPGWSWPDDLASRLEAARRDGRPVILDLRPTSWIGDEQRAALRETQAWAGDRASEGSTDLIVWR